MKIILIGNYIPDGQESMERFAKMLEMGFNDSGIETEFWRPQSFFGENFKSTKHGLGKWFGYIDKWVLFPLKLKWKLAKKEYRSKDIHFHICDHSNSFYLSQLPIDRTVITCHDVLAIRGGLGYKDSYCESTGMGTILQKKILKYLSRAKYLAAVSNFTLNQLKEICYKHIDSSDKHWTVIYNSFNAPFTEIDKNTRQNLLINAGLNPKVPFIFHIGSNLKRKNRKLLIDMLVELGDCWHGNVYFAGQPLEESLSSYANDLGLGDRIVSITKPNHSLLTGLYSSCEAFIFPSYSEGFGWPLIEAQACGAPVIASDIEPMPEVSNNSAIHADPNNPQEFALAFKSLRNENIKNTIIKNGFENIKRFEFKKIINSYIDLHNIASY